MINNQTIKQSNNQINVMTSCDGYYYEYVYNQIINLAKTQKKFVNFFFLYSRIPDKDIVKLINFCKNINNLNLYPIKVTKNIESYNLLAKYGGFSATSNGLFPFEVYFQLNAYEILPNWVDRILVIHAGDILFLNDISSYYESDFNDKLVTLELTNYLISDDRTNVNSDLYKITDREYFITKYKGKSSYFNSGVILLNVSKQRENKRSIQYYIDIQNEINKISRYYTGDQAFYSIAYLGEVNILNGIIETKKNHRRYNYSSFAYKKDMLYGFQNTVPVSIFHFDGKYKPWLFSREFLESNFNKTLTKDQFDKKLHDFVPSAFLSYFKKFWEYDSDSPFHVDHETNAKLYSKIWKDFCIPFIKKIEKQNHSNL